MLALYCVERPEGIHRAEILQNGASRTPDQTGSQLTPRKW